MSEKIGICTDHAGLELKNLILDFLKVASYETVDYGISSKQAGGVDYPDYAALVASDLSKKKINCAIGICGSAIGMSIVANKFPEVYAALVHDEFTARMSKMHNNANMICLGSRTLNHHRAVDYVKLWLEAKFVGQRHTGRLEKIAKLEKDNFKT